MDYATDKGTTITVDEAHGIIGKTKISRGAFYAAINRKEVPHLRLRSEERRVGKECRSRWSPYH